MGGNDSAFFLIKRRTGVWPCSVGCVEKLKNTKSNYGYSYFIAPWSMVYRNRKNMIFLILRFFSLGGDALKISLTPL